ncbi:hypothetical protein PIROE2DRAFT_2423 [Piromyces sp. E2]|nr:hypothetical protein PIROE2DRAFT_2423 [Piromyces sp. E2]|eukprot:OUM69562.1 hypothetical protein PIROE2DRAFT_2423 [Piromyces sp. E2]
MKGNEEKNIKYDAVGPTPVQDLETPYNTLYKPDIENTVGFVLPNNSENDKIINSIMNNNIFNSTQPIKFNNEQEMDDYVIKNNHRMLAGIIFESDDYLQYTIRVNNSFVPDPATEPITNYAYGRYKIQSNNMISYSYVNVFAPIQEAVDQAIIRLKTNDDSFNLVHQVGTLGKPEVEYTPVRDMSKNIISYDISAIYIISILTIVNSLVQEKESKIKDGLLMSGIHPTIFWLSWLCVYIVCILIVSVLVSALFYFAKVFGSLNPIVILLILFFYGLSCCNMAFLFSTFFKRTKTAGTAVSIIVIILIMANMGISYINNTIKIIISFLFSPISVGSLIQNIYDMKINGIAYSFSNIIKNDADITFVALVFTNILYFVLAVIFDSYLLGGNSYIFNKNVKINDIHDENEISYQRDIQEDFNAKNNETCRVEVSRVHKIFKRKNNDTNDDDDTNNKNNKHEFLAVNDVSFKVYQNEIFAILGK